MNFDAVYNRKNTNCLKWDSIEQTYGKSELLPLWIADMDFKADKNILNGLQKVIEQGILGYTAPSESLYSEIKNWQKSQNNYLIDDDSILFNSGVVPSISIAIQAFTNPGDGVLIHDPVYPPFAQVVKQNHRKLVRSKLTVSDNRFIMDMDEMEQLILNENIRLFILCNPHNPGGRVWKREELEAIGKLCAAHDVLVVSDEIHQDLIFPPHSFTTFHNVDPSFKDFSIILTAATKTFNLAAIKNSMVFIQNKILRNKFLRIQEQNAQNEINIFGYVGTELAYKNGKPWLDELLVYLSQNIDSVEQFLAREMPHIQMMRPEGTYLIWLDFSALGFTDTELEHRLVHQGNVVLNPGISFGPSGAQHMRLNVACPNQLLMKGLTGIKTAFG